MAGVLQYKTSMSMIQGELVSDGSVIAS